MVEQSNDTQTINCMLNHWAFECQRVKALCDGIGPCRQDLTTGFRTLQKTTENVARLPCSKFLMLLMCKEICCVANRVEMFGRGWLSQKLQPSVKIAYSFCTGFDFCVSCQEQQQAWQSFFRQPRLLLSLNSVACFQTYFTSIVRQVLCRGQHSP